MTLSRSLIRLSNISRGILVQETSILGRSRVVLGCMATKMVSNLSPRVTCWTVYRHIHDDRSKIDSKIPASEESGSNEQEKKDENKEEVNLTQVQRLRKVFAEYGSTAVVFHVCISLTSLGICYMAVKR